MIGTYIHEEYSRLKLSWINVVVKSQTNAKVFTLHSPPTVPLEVGLGETAHEKCDCSLPLLAIKENTSLLLWTVSLAFFFSYLFLPQYSENKLISQQGEKKNQHRLHISKRVKRMVDKCLYILWNYI